MYHVQQHYYDKRHSDKSWSSLLTSPLAENNEGKDAFQVLQQSVEKDHFKRRDNCQMFRNVLQCSDAKTQLNKVKQPAVNKSEMAVGLFPAERAVSRLKAVVQLRVLVSEHERTPLNIRWLSCLSKQAFFADCWSTWLGP